MTNSKLEEKTTVPWNKGKLPGQKKPLKQQDIWAIRIRLQLSGNIRDLAMFNLAIDSKLRGCDLVKLRVNDISNGSIIFTRATVLQQKTGQPVQFEITKQTRDAIADWIHLANLALEDHLFFSRRHGIEYVSTRHYARMVKRWVNLIGLDPSIHGTHSLRRTKATIIYRQTRNIRAVQLLLGHTKLESTVRYLGIDVDDALTLAEQIEV